MEQPTLEYLTLRAIEKVNEANKRVHKYNDFGSALGFQDSFYDLFNELDHAVRCASRKAQRLMDRIEKWESGNHEVEKL
jgi:hypothetical protein